MKDHRTLEEKIASKKKIIECLECCNYSERSIAFKRRELDELIQLLPRYKR